MDAIEIGVSKLNLLVPGNSTWRDWLGIVASVGCAIHCAAMPFVIAYLPALGLSFLADESFHRWMALTCFFIALIAFIPGLLKHGSWIPVSAGVVGLVLITVAAFGLTGDCCPSCVGETIISAGPETEPACCETKCEHCETTQPGADAEDTYMSVETSTLESGSWLTQFAPWITPTGGVLLVAAHLLNRRYGCLCKCCESRPFAISEVKTIR